MTTKWKIDPTHSEIQFKVRHLMITTVTGDFKNFNLELQTEDDDFTKATAVIFTAEVNSISTNNEQRDQHLKGEDFFNAEKFPQIKFVGKEIRKHEDHFHMTGNLTIRDVTLPLELKVEFGGTVTDPYGQNKAGFTLEGKLSRKDFGIAWNASNETGVAVVSDEVKINCEVQVVKQK